MPTLQLPPPTRRIKTAAWQDRPTSHWLAACRACAIPAGSIKTAELGGGQDQPFESAFSNLAHAFVRDKASKLMDYEVGFQLIEKSQDNTRAVGVFGFKIGNQWLYAPVFFLNGDLKGHELLYVKHQDMFVPLDEEWVNHLLGKKPSILGESLNRNLSTVGVMPPNLYQLSRSPNKFASAQDPDIAKWAADVLPDLSYFATTDPLQDPKYVDMRGLDSFLKEGGKTSFRFFLEKIAGEYPHLAHAFDALYGEEFLNKLASHFAAVPSPPSRSILKTGHDRPLAPEQVVISPPAETQRAVNPPDECPEEEEEDEEEETGHKEAGRKRKKKSIMARRRKRAADVDGTGGKVKVVLSDEIERPGGNDLIHDLDAKERETLVSARIVVRDNRDDKDVTLAYNVDAPFSLKNPDRTNVYAVLVRPDKFERCLVIFGPYTYSGARIFCTVVSLESKEWVNIHPSHVWIDTEADDEGFDKWFKELPDGEALSSESHQLLLMPQGGGTCPFRVEKDYNGEIYDVHFHDHAERTQPLYQQDYPRDWRTQDGAAWHGSRIRLTGHPGRRIRVTDGEVQVPQGAKRIELTDDGEPLQPGNVADMTRAMLKQMPELRVYADGKDVTIDEDRKLNKLAAVKHLILHYRLREKTARAILELAEARSTPTNPFRCLLKVAAPLSGDMITGAPNAPPFPEPYMGWDPMTGSNVPTVNPTELNTKVPEMSGHTTDRSIYRPQGPDPRSMGVAQEAARTGQKEVFDTAMLGSLLKSVRDDSLVDKYMGDLMKGMDRLGRILFLFYWRGDSFEERYGQQDMPELEDGLRNAFDSIGTIVLFLKKKAVEPYPDDGSGADLGDVANS